jgi:hypothetical protein
MCIYLRHELTDTHRTVIRLDPIRQAARHRTGFVNSPRSQLDTGHLAPPHHRVRCPVPRRSRPLHGVALPSIGRSLHLSAGSLQWIVSGYVLGYGSFLLLGGRTSDLISRRTVFLTAVAVFGVASVISAGLSNELALVALRFVKGASAGFTVPAGLSILTTTLKDRLATEPSGSTPSVARAGSRSDWYLAACSPKSVGAPPSSFRAQSPYSWWPWVGE